MSITSKSNKGRIDATHNKSPFFGIGKSFRTKIDPVKEYEILENNEDIKGDFFYGMPFGLNHNEYVNAQNLKRALMDKYKGMEISEVIKGRENDSGHGSIFTINYDIPLKLKNFQVTRQKKKSYQNLN